MPLERPHVLIVRWRVLWPWQISGAFLVEDIAPDLPDSDAPVTAENVVAVIIA